jgi:cytochrome c553
LETEDYSISAPNLTTGPGSVTFWYTEVDWDRAIRHGVAPDGRGLRFMPSEDFARWSDRDLAAVVAWIRTLPPTIGTATTFRVPVLRRIARGYGLIPDAADRIDHSLPAADPGDPAPTAEYGTYVAAACVRCHGEGFSGGPIPGALPGWPPAPNLTPGYDSAMVQYADFQEFAAVFTRNERPDGTPLSASLPRSAHGSWNDTELRALYELLLTLPPRPFGNR